MAEDTGLRPPTPHRFAWDEGIGRVQSPFYGTGQVGPPPRGLRSQVHHSLIHQGPAPCSPGPGTGTRLHQSDTPSCPGGHSTAYSPSTRPSSPAPKLLTMPPPQLQTINDPQPLPCQTQAPQPGIGGPAWSGTCQPLPPHACLGFLRKEPHLNLSPLCLGVI